MDRREPKYGHEWHRYGLVRGDLGVDRKLSVSVVDRYQNLPDPNYIDALHKHILICRFLANYPPDHFSPGVIELMI